MAESIQHKLDRVRPPRVQITYDVEIGGAIEMKELPFVVGVIADLSGDNAGKVTNPKGDVLDMKKRKFVEVDRDNFNPFLASCMPKLEMLVPYELEKTAGGAKSDKNLKVDLDFRSIDDFEPFAIVKRVPEIKRLYDARCRLRDLLTKLDGNDPLIDQFSKLFEGDEPADAAKDTISGQLQELIGEDETEKKEFFGQED